MSTQNVDHTKVLFIKQARNERFALDSAFHTSLLLMTSEKYNANEKPGDLKLLNVAFFH